MRRPTLLEPVNETIAISGSTQIPRPLDAPWHHLQDAFRQPAFRICGHNDPPRRTRIGLQHDRVTVASAGATARIERINGLNGEITPITPRGHAWLD
jgi:hypothetical protein